MAVNEELRSFQHPLYEEVLKFPGGSVAVASLDAILTWGVQNALWVFPMATSCCGIELMAAAAARVDLDRMGTIIRGSPRQADVMVVAGTITVKMAPRVRRLWDQMPEPKWCIAMGSCAISGDFYRDIYSVVPGIDAVVPVDVYVPGCPPNPEALMQGLLTLQERIGKDRKGEKRPAPQQVKPENKVILPVVGRVRDADRDPEISRLQTEGSQHPSDPAGVAPGAVLLAQPPATMDASAQVAEILSRHGVSGIPTDAPPLVPAGNHLALARELLAAGFTSFTYVVASHWPAPAPKEGEAPREDELEIAYGVRRPTRSTELATWRVRIPVSGHVDSLAAVWAGADWQEREQADLVGVTFRGHPDPRRLMMPDTWEGHPLRRDYAIDTPCRPWR